MAHPLSIVPPSANPGTAADEYVVTPRRLAPYVLKAFADAHQDGRRCTLDDLCDQIPVRRADLRRTVSALHANDLLDALRGRLTLRGLAVAVALARQCEVPVREAIRGVERSAERTSKDSRGRDSLAKTA
jgi:hypothetical protein